MSESAFEALAEDDGPFGLVVAAQCFHRTDPDTRWQRLVDVLAPGAAAAMFWNRWALDASVHDLDAVKSLYDRHEPSLTPDIGDNNEAEWPRDEIVGTAELVDLVERTYPWTRELAALDYVALLGTTSQYSVLPEDARSGLFDDLRAALGDRVTLQGRTLLFQMRRSVATGPRP